MADHAHAHGEPAHHEEAHASPRTYVRIAIILAIITFVEVVIYYVPSIRPILVPALIILSLAKFIMVVGFFMHLKFDDRRLTSIFVTGLFFAFSIIMALYALFHWHAIDHAADLL